MTQGCRLPEQASNLEKLGPGYTLGHPTREDVSLGPEPARQSTKFQRIFMAALNTAYKDAASLVKHKPNTVRAAIADCQGTVSQGNGPLRHGGL